MEREQHLKYVDMKTIMLIQEQKIRFSIAYGNNAVDTNVIIFLSFGNVGIGIT